MCQSVRPSVTSRYCIERTGRIELVFDMEASFHLSYTVEEILVSQKFLCHFVPNFGLGKFRHSESMVLSTELVVVVVDGRPC